MTDHETGGQPRLRRMKSLVRPERGPSRRYKPMVTSEEHHKNPAFSRQPHAPLLLAQDEHERKNHSAWGIFVTVSTFLCFDGLLRKIGGMHDPKVQRAWREKMALCIIILFLCGMVAFITYGIRAALCTGTNNRFLMDALPVQSNGGSLITVSGTLYNLQGTTWAVSGAAAGSDQTGAFVSTLDQSACGRLGLPSLSCTGNCRTVTLSQLSQYEIGQLAYDWDDLASAGHVVVNGQVLHVTNPSSLTWLGSDYATILANNVGEDATKALLRLGDMDKINCMVNRYRIGYLNKESVGCLISDVVNYTILVVVLAYILIRFILALIFRYIVSRRLTRVPPRAALAMKGQQSVMPVGGAMPDGRSNRSTLLMSAPQTSRFSRLPEPNVPAMQSIGQERRFGEVPTIMLVTCYSEGEKALRTTLESLVATDYRDDNKLLFIVADGLITGSGNAMSTPDLLVQMMEIDAKFTLPEPKSYIAVASGVKQHNKAVVYAGWFNHDGHRVPTILVIKCGTEAERSLPKPGNRGKRDSQIILMNFLSKIMFNDRMTELEFDIAHKIANLTSAGPDAYELILMVDADTEVDKKSLQQLVNATENDPMIMGLCGETRITNKGQSFTTAIQVFEYYISHHLGKAFESMFGGVTCLPGCFCMYRIKVRKGDRMMPVLINPDIVEEYSQNTVETLHQKNLLLLGEDRFLTTLMLRAFPKRKMMFVPTAICHTMVPDEFKVLLSQRRRWINSTIHNLLELLLVKDLCGIFCFSMQFVILLDLIASATLPAAITMTVVLIINMALSNLADSIVPFVMLMAVLLLPGILVLFTTHKWQYFLWLFVYLIGLPIWNFVLPTYAYWHFDDFSWGDTRKVHGSADEKSGHSSEGHFDPRSMNMKRWAEWERALRRQTRKSQAKSDWSVDESSIRGDVTQSMYREEKPRAIKAPDASMMLQLPPDLASSVIDFDSEAGSQREQATWSRRPLDSIYLQKSQH